MADRLKWIEVKSSHRDEFPLSLTPGWVLIPAREVPSIVPKALRLKLDSAVQIITPTSTGGFYLTYSGNRVDGDKIDIEPFGLIVHPTGPASEGLFIHHGQWPERTTQVPSDFAAHIVNTGTGSYFMTYPPNGLVAGALNQLPEPHRGALTTIIAGLRAREDG